VRALLLVAIVGCSPSRQAPPSTHAANVHVDRRVELVSIVERLAGGKEYTQATGPYADAVDRWFTPFASLPAVADAVRLRAGSGISYDAPMTLAIHLDEQLRVQHGDELATIDARWKGVDVDAFAADLRQFAAAAKLDDFLATQASTSTAIETSLRAAIDREDPVTWFDAMFGPAKARFLVVPARLTGPWNYGPRATLSDGTLELVQVLGVHGPGGTLPIDDDLTSLLVHEMAHSYINPVFAKHRDQLAAAGATLYPRVERQMRQQAYADWVTMLNESAVRATVALYLRERKGDAASASAVQREQRNGFLWTADLVEVLRTFQHDPAHHADLDGYMPAIVAFFDRLAAQPAGDRRAN